MNYAKFAEMKAQHLENFRAMKDRFGEEYYALRKCANAVITYGEMSAVRKTRNDTLTVGIKCLDYPTLFMSDSQNEFTFEMKELEGYFRSGRIVPGLNKYQLEDAMKTAFKSINVFLMQFA